MVKKTLAEILISLGADSAKIQQCQEEATQTGVSLEACLLDKKVVTETDLAKAWASYTGWPMVDKITDTMADVNTIAKVPLKFLRDNVIIPIKKSRYS